MDHRHLFTSPAHFHDYGLCNCSIFRCACYDCTRKREVPLSIFLSEKPKNGILRIHGGTLFDYVFVINGKLNGKQRTDFIIHQYLQGFLKFTEEHERGYDDKLIIRGTSYIMNKNTATKLGFKIVETDVIQKVLLLYHAVNIILSYSIAKGKLSLPNLRQTITFEATLGELIKQKPYIQELISRFQSQHQKKP